jgi:hypothetical protein
MSKCEQWEQLSTSRLVCLAQVLSWLALLNLCSSGMGALASGMAQAWAKLGHARSYLRGKGSSSVVSVSVRGAHRSSWLVAGVLGAECGVVWRGCRSSLCWCWCRAGKKKYPDFSKRSPAHTVSHAGHTPNTRCTPILALSPYPPPYQLLWLVSWGGVPPTMYLQTRSPHPRGLARRTDQDHAVFVVVRGRECVHYFSQPGWASEPVTSPSSPWTPLNKEVPDRGSQLDYSSGFVFVLFLFCVSSGVGTCLLARPTLGMVVLPGQLRGAGPGLS